VISLEEARARILPRCPRLQPQVVPRDEALGCVTATAVTATVPVPPFPNSAMDGYAVQAADTARTPVRLAVVGTLSAGADPSPFSVEPGQAVRIMTGAAIPAGADAVVMVERTRVDDGGATVVVEVPARAGDHVRPAGEDLAPGQEVFPPSTVLNPGGVGVLASLGLDEVLVFPRARVGVVSTGDELVEGPGELRPGQIRDSNRPTLLALLEESGCEPVDLGVVADDEVEIAQALERGLASCHVVITSGGVSMGEFDYVKAVLDKLSGGETASMQVAIKPAKPLSFVVVEGRPVFGLPGNPVSSVVSFELFARPALRQMMGHHQLERLHVDAVADDGLPRRPDGKLHLVRVRASYEADGRFHVRPSGGQGSNLLRSMALANALALVPDGEGVGAGGSVRVMLLAYP
jgi:molybdopterin molybdotransferase